MLKALKKRGRKPGGFCRHPGLCADAKELGVSPGHLLLVIEGSRESDGLKARYCDLQARRQREAAAPPQARFADDGSQRQAATISASQVPYAARPRQTASKTTQQLQF